MSKFELNTTKLGELILYFARRGARDPAFGTTRLYKELFLADFWAYRELGRPITGETYLHLRHGPAPKHFRSVRSALVRSGKLRFAGVDVGGHIQKRPEAVAKPDTSLFSEKELDIIERAANELAGLSAKEVSEWSHERPGWRVTGDHQEIPYEMAFMWYDDPISHADLEWARTEVARRANPAR